MKAKYYSGFLVALSLAFLSAKSYGSSAEGYSRQGEPTIVVNNYFDNYDYFYSSRINRFHRDYVLFDYYSPVFTDSYWYDYRPFTWGISIYPGGLGFTMGYNFFSPLWYRTSYYYDYGWYDPYFYDPYYWNYTPYYSYWYTPVYINIGFGSRWFRNFWGWNRYNNWYGYNRFNYYRPYNRFNYNRFYNDFHASGYSSGYRNNGGYNANQYPTRRTESSSVFNSGSVSRRNASTMTRSGAERTRTVGNTGTFTPNTPPRRNTGTLSGNNGVVRNNNFNRSAGNSAVNGRRAVPSGSTRSMISGNSISGRSPVSGQSSVRRSTNQALPGSRIQSAGRAPQRISTPGRSFGSFSAPSSAGRRSSASVVSSRSRSAGSTSFGASSSRRGSSVSSGRSSSRSSSGGSSSHSSRSSSGSSRRK